MWNKKKSEVLLDSEWVKVRKDKVELPNGSSINDFYVVSLKEASGIIALDTKGNLILKSEYRYTYDKE